MAVKIHIVDGVEIQTTYYGGPWTPQVEAQAAAEARARGLTRMGCSSCGGGVKWMAEGSCPPSVAVGSTRTLNAIIPTGKEGQPPYSYSWGIVRPDNQVDTLSGPNPSYTFTMAGQYIINLTATDSCSTPQTCTSSCVTQAEGAAQRYSCSGAPNYQCTADPNGPYADLASCQAACVAPAQRYRCSGAPNYQCTADPNGPYADLASCQAACQPTCQPFSCSAKLL